jgi:outer membrane protein OmpU
MSVGIETESYNPRERIMKKVLLTTTALVMTAGVAAAEVTFSGTAGIAFVDDNGAQAAAAVNSAERAAAATAAARAVLDAQAAVAAYLATDGAADGDATDTANDAAVTAAQTAQGNLEANDVAGINAQRAAARAAGDGMRAVSFYDLDVAVSAETQTGVTMSASFDMGAGERVDYDDDDMVEVQGADVGDADVAVSYMGWTATVDEDGIDNLFDDTQQHDISVAGSVAGLSIAVAAGLQEDTSSYSLGYTMGDLTLGLTGTNDDDAGGSASGISLGYTMGALSLSASMVDESNDGEDDASIGLTYNMDAITVSYTTIRPGSNGNYGDEWDMSIAYSAGAMSASFAVDEADATTMIGEYDLGGATAFVAMHDKAGEANDLTTVGINFAF